MKRLSVSKSWFWANSVCSLYHPVCTVPLHVMTLPCTIECSTFCATIRKSTASLFFLNPQEMRSTSTDCKAGYPNTVKNNKESMSLSNISISSYTIKSIPTSNVTVPLQPGLRHRRPYTLIILVRLRHVGSSQIVHPS